MRLFAHALAALALAASFGTAHAGTFNYSSVSQVNGVAVTLNDKDLDVSATVSAGMFQLHGTDGSTLSTFCFDIKDPLRSSGSFTTGTMTGSIADSVNALLSHVTVSDKDRYSSAALQVALWETEYGSALTVSSSTADVLDTANYYLAQVHSGAWTADRTMQVSLLAGGGKNQDQVYLSRVPEPTTVAVLGTGLLGLCALRQRRAARAVIS